MSIRNVWKNFQKNEAGSFAAMGAVGLLALLLMVGFAVDTHNMTNKRQRLQAASDAIALKAFQSGEHNTAALTAIAQEHLAFTFSAEELNQLNIAAIARVGDEVKVTLAQDLSNDSGFFLPRSDVGVSAASSAGNAGARINFALVLDTTSSMNTNGRIQSLMTACLLYTSPSPRDRTRSRMPSSA